VNILKRLHPTIFDSLHEIFEFGELFDFIDYICLNQATVPSSVERSVPFLWGRPDRAGSGSIGLLGLLRNDLGEMPNLLSKAVEKLAWVE